MNSLSSRGYLGVSFAGSHFIVSSDGILAPAFGTHDAIYISNLPEGKTYTSTQFEFRFGQATRVVEDPHNQVEWVAGEFISAREAIRTEKETYEEG